MQSTKYVCLEIKLSCTILAAQCIINPVGGPIRTPPFTGSRPHAYSERLVIFEADATLANQSPPPCTNGPSSGVRRLPFFVAELGLLPEFLCSQLHLVYACWLLTVYCRSICLYCNYKVINLNTSNDLL